MALNPVTRKLKFLLNPRISKMLYKMSYSNLPVKYNFKKLESNIGAFPNTNNNINPNHQKKFIQSFPTTNNLDIGECLLNNHNKSHTRYSTKTETACKVGRHQFHAETEKAINDQISAEYDAAFAYLTMACFFGRTEVALPGCQGFFMNMYEEELTHAMIFVNYQLLRGAPVLLCPISMPENQNWKCIINAFAVSLEMEKLIKEKLVCLFKVAEKHMDLQVMDIVSTQFMEEQNRSICEMARLLTRAKMANDPVGEYLFDKMLFKSFVKKSKGNLMYKKKLEESAEDEVYK